MADQSDQYENSWILHHILERIIGSPELMETRRRMVLMAERIKNNCLNSNSRKLLPILYTGSLNEGIPSMSGSDGDFMFILDDVIPIYPPLDPEDYSQDKTVLIMREDVHSQPGYVTLELCKVGSLCSKFITQSIVPVRNAHCISSEMFRRAAANVYYDHLKLVMEPHGPAITLKTTHSNSAIDCDFVYCFPCTWWPREAYEWLSRPRLHGWPNKTLRDQIVQDGCHLVPVGDKTSDDAFLQWRISFASAERKLIYSLTHTQFLIYGLLKSFLKQISSRLKGVYGDEDIISSYIIKTILFYVVETTPALLWQERNTFCCFMLCFETLIAMVQSGHCPNYFIHSNNMFYRKVHGEKQQKMLRILIDLRDMKWGCLSVGRVMQPSLGDLLQCVRNGACEIVLRSPTELEMKCDLEIFNNGFEYQHSYALPNSLTLLLKSNLDIEEFYAYLKTVNALCFTGINTFVKCFSAKGNKAQYRSLRKSKILSTPLSSVCKSPGLLTLATYHYQTGNVRKTLEMCEKFIASSNIFVAENVQYFSNKDIDWYKHFYCGRGYTLFHKCREVWISLVKFQHHDFQFCPSHLHPELTQTVFPTLLSIPPLPYAVFLTFLCYHELGYTRRRDAALIHLRAVKYDENQGGSKYWIVYNLLGICYEIVGDKHQALREYGNSLASKSPFQYNNPVRKRIERLQQSQNIQM